MNGSGGTPQTGPGSVPERNDPAAEALAEGFAQHVERWARRLHGNGGGEATRPPAEEDFAILRHAACQASLATSNGHVCLMLAELATPAASAGEGQIPSPSPSGGGLGWGQNSLHRLRESLLRTGVVGTSEAPGACPLILDADGRLYLHRYFDYEVRLARRIRQAARTPPRAVTPAARELLRALFPAPVDDAIDWQKIAAALALRNTLTVISGGPGTGKTTTVVNLLACLVAQEPDARIALAAPTGKAAARMTEAIRQRADHLPAHLRERLPAESFTIHRLLGANPGRGTFTHDAGNPLPYDALIVDEASMLDLALATRLLEAVPASARIILLGDKDQLAAVEAGAVFAELSADPALTDECRRDVAQLCGYAPARIVPVAPPRSSPLHDAAVWLTRNYRFPADSGIGRLATYINEGRAGEAMALLRESRATQPASEPQAVVAAATKPRSAKKRDEETLSLFPELAGPGAAAAAPAVRRPGPDTSIRWLDPEQGEGGDVLEAILAGYDGYFQSIARDPPSADAIFRAFDSFRVLCAVREGSSGSNSVNEQVARRGRQLLAQPAPDQSLARRSAWYPGRPVMVLRNDYVNKLFNGDIGIALPADGGLAVHFPDGEGGFKAVPIARMPPHETAYATTVHKAQGSEFERLLVLLPPRPARVLTRELLYTAITRSRAAVTVHARADVLAATIGAKVRRDSGLRGRA